MTLVKILFIVPGEEDDDLESLWAEKWGEEEGQYVLKNTPFSVKGVAWGDLVVAEQTESDLWFKETIRHSGHGTVWVSVARQGDVEAVTQVCKMAGANVESVDATFLTIDVPPGRAMANLSESLDEFRRKGIVNYEIGCLASDA